MAGIILLFGGGIELFIAIIETSTNKYYSNNDIIMAVTKNNHHYDQGCWKRAQKWLSS
jgi:hypothetical protein